MYGFDFFGFKRRYDKEIGFDGFIGKVYKENHKKVEDVIRIARKYKY